MEDLKNFIKQQEEQLAINSQVDVARVQGFYQGAQQTLSVIKAEIAQEEAIKAKELQKKEVKKETK